MELVPIGVIHSPYRSPDDAPNQGRFSDKQVELEIYPDYVGGLKDIEESSYLIVLYWLHLAKRDVLVTKTPFGPELRGVFACRSPSRPNPIAFCVAKLLGRKGNRLLVQGVEAVDGSPLLDLKPYSSDLDCIPGIKIGWLNKKRED
ncbi:MAG: tRNA (N6-threonylcarbamoyladenosine(37)-N6)-methyltransferase TrmO [Thermacetogeniaceae bacterium]|nr:tRNA (N6-threonylcarbamoyladenosine(37)-N6)-methyltransferase TrmO [Syntrophomonadaceae bacterium]